MSSAIRKLAAFLFFCALPVFAASQELRVCADPNNLALLQPAATGLRECSGKTGSQ